jgi:hypothetical protein
LINMNSVFLLRSLVLASMVCASVVQATTLSGALTADNEFSLYISQNDAQLGELVTSGNDWTTTYSFSKVLTPGVDQYLHVVATNWGGPAALIGGFSLSDTHFEFPNLRHQHLATEAGLSTWRASSVGFGSYDLTVVELALNNAPNGIWGAPRPGIPGNAAYIWGTGTANSTEYFSVKLTSTAPVPEPESLALLLAGLGVVGVWAHRRANHPA